MPASTTQIPQEGVEAGVVECAATPLGDQVVGRLDVEFVDEVGPAGRQCGAAAGPSGLGAPRRASGDVDQDHGQAVSPELGGQVGRLFDDGGDRTAGVGRDDALLQVDHDERGPGVDRCQCHGGRSSCGCLLVAGVGR
jgi:hypothetical protein